MRELLFMEPVFKEAIWGGTRLKDVFGYDIPSSRTGECWAISAHKNGDCRIAGGTWKGQSLKLPVGAATLSGLGCGRLS